ncbi:hypothetical protein HPB52_007321 [Rhipicephalus sanguineus]|uniref:Uncharacterized protein n=1 Tax=Rhipicephalus sanguineus TaxID=34632 RepID=A0A9D4SZQ6_RHISA|nr:hypothetical protein HPB52_007321 [Rhipicephalus sanguineus]
MSRVFELDQYARTSVPILPRSVELSWPSKKAGGRLQHCICKLSWLRRGPAFCHVLLLCQTPHPRALFCRNLDLLLRCCSALCLALKRTDREDGTGGTACSFCAHSGRSQLMTNASRRGAFEPTVSSLRPLPDGPAQTPSRSLHEYVAVVTPFAPSSAPARDALRLIKTNIDADEDIRDVMLRHTRSQLRNSRGPVSGHDSRRPHQVGLTHDPALGHCTQAGAVRQASSLTLEQATGTVPWTGYRPSTRYAGTAPTPASGTSPAARHLARRTASSAFVA